MDRLGDEARQGALRAFAVDGIEAEGDAEQRAEDGDELVECRHPVGGQGEQVEEDRRHVGGGAGGVADRTAGRVHRGQTGEGDEHDQDDEAHRVNVVGELLAGDDPPSAGQPSERVGSSARRRGCQASTRWSLSSVLPMK